jgi:hypothetical protein
MLDNFDNVIYGTPATDVELAALERELGTLLGTGDIFGLPSSLSYLLGSGVAACIRDIEGRYIEFGWLGLDMADYLTAYEFSEYMPGALPIALDGGGGFYALDCRSDGVNRSQPIVWSHSGNLGWESDEHRVVASDFDRLIGDATAG